MSRGRLSREVILNAAMELLDRNGFEGLTVRGLAERLEVAPMAMYRHFDGKHALIEAILDRATSEIALPPPGLAPAEALVALARGIRTTVLRHAPLVPALIAHPSLGPSALMLRDRGEAALQEAGLTGDEVSRAWNLIAVYALGFAIVEAPRAPAGVAGNGADQAFASRLAPSPPAEFTSEAQFEHGLDRILVGVLGRAYRGTEEAPAR